VRADPIIKATALMMEAVRTYETSVYFHKTTRRCIPQSCHLHNRRRKNLKFRILFTVVHTWFMSVLIYGRQ
jgi:hypothetical protein